MLRLRVWEGPDTKTGLDTLDKGGLYQRVSAKFKVAIDELVAHGTPEDQAALCVMLGEDAAFSRTLKGEGRGYLRALQLQIPQVVKLSQETAPQDRIVREEAAAALARMRAPAKDQIEAVELLLEKDGADVAARRAAYKALILPFEAAAPRTLSASPNATQYSATDQLAYAAETRQLLDDHAGIALPFLVQGLKDPDLEVRTMSINALRDIAAILLVPLQPAPRLSKDVIDFDFRLKPMIDVIKRLQPLTDQLATNGPALVAAADDPAPSIRLHALVMLNDLAESRNRIRDWRAQFERATPPPPPEKPPVNVKPVGDARDRPSALPVALEAEQPPKADAKGVPGDDKLTAAVRGALKVLAKNLADPDVKIRLAALEVLESLGQDANSPDTLPALLNALGDTDKYVSWNAIRIFNRFGPIEPEAVVPRLIPLIQSSEGDGDYAKILGPTLSAYGSKAASAVPALMKGIQSGEPDARIAYLQALTYVGPAGVDALPAITPLLKFENAHVRQAAAETLGRFGKLASTAKPNLRAGLDDENPDVRKAVAEALLRIDGK